MENEFNFVLALPEILLAVLAMGILLLEAFVKSKNACFSYVASLITLVLLIVVQLIQWNAGESGTTFYGMFVLDPMAHLFKVLSYIAVLVTLIYGRQYMMDRDMIRGGEPYALTLLALLGQMVMISASSMLTIYLGLELMSLSLYALIAIRRDDRTALESAMKYFVLGSLASGFLLYGISLVYGATGQINLSAVLEVSRQLIASNDPKLMSLMLATVFIVGGLAFKMGAVPFHMWAPDVYQGSPTAITLTLGAAPKLAVMVMLMRLLVEGLHETVLSWQPMLMILAVLSLLVGNLTAIVQTNFKRMLAYSTISQVGFIFLGLFSGYLPDGSVATGAYGASLYYIIIYVLTTLATFGMILILSRKGFECEQISDLAGLNKRNPAMALGILLLMFSLAGIPPLAGFYAKLAVLQATIAAGYFSIAIFGVVMSLIGAFYYLRVVKVMYFDQPSENAPAIGNAFSFRSGVMSVNTLLVLLLGILPGALMMICVQVIDASLKF
ncbi:NADH-quinone oxidoreductase subunit NuoN [Basilea psittacipulmonis]|uniref:NADH-quinone oxidoreductase subunit N n=1 Tax=Basilea psittacipulmonis DSM 24701 TaxID=1072685 RepID=A0A077DG92_9BURK|nr:NADH-quinone oxidoreductase subunit NuoN [Basilea psittacipulmonis]AIL33191.1 NADH:ubiquinone oxidoreductase subunit N [Basilea psittacipulmonis DSM 24701]